jgi:hypothetical protein
VREALATFGIGTIAAPSVVDTTPTVVAAPAQACSPLGTVVSVTSPQTAAALAGHPLTRPHGAVDERPHLRGPPAPLDMPASPFATSGSAAVAPGGASGDHDCAINADQIAFTLADAGTAVAADSRDHAAPAPTTAGARAPPVA